MGGEQQQVAIALGRGRRGSAIQIRHKNKNIKVAEGDGRDRIKEVAHPTFSDAMTNDTKVLDIAERVEVMSMVVERPPGVGRRERTEGKDFLLDDAGSDLHELSINKQVFGQPNFCQIVGM